MSCCRRASFLSLIILCCLSTRLLAQEWTRFRGPDGSGASDTAKFPATWTDKDYRWQAKLPGPGHSSPVVWDDRIYVTATDDDASQVVCCLNTVDGTTVWTKKLASKPHHINDFNSFAASTPTVDKDRLYACWATPDAYMLVALDRHTGNEVWRRDFGPLRGRTRIRGLAHPV